MSNIVRLLNPIIPAGVASHLRTARTRIFERRIASLPVDQAFDVIYSFGLWGVGGTSGQGSYNEWAEAFVRTVSKIVERSGVTSIADIGCGDFSVGSRIAPLVESYTGYDVSGRIIERNKARFANMKNLRFEKFNIIETVPPAVDLVLVRQVLQHLSNYQIECSLRNIEASGAKTVLIAEGIHENAVKAPNLDLKHQSIGTRSGFRSGVILEAEPFNRKVHVIEEVGEARGESRNSILRIVRLETSEP